MYKYVLRNDNKKRGRARRRSVPSESLQAPAPPITPGKTLIFDMPFISGYENFDLNSKFFYKRQYLKRIYLPKLIWFEDDNIPATRHTRLYVYKLDYHASFELESHPQQPRVLRNSMMLLDLLCRNELSSPEDFCVQLTTEMKAVLEAQTDQYYAHIGLGKMLVEDMMPKHILPTSTLLAPGSFIKPTVGPPAVVMPANKFGEWTALKPTPKSKPKPRYQLTPASTPASTPDLTPEATPNTTPKPSPKCKPEAVRILTTDVTPETTPGPALQSLPFFPVHQPAQPPTGTEKPGSVNGRRPRLPPRKFRQIGHKDRAMSQATFDVCEVHRSMSARGYRRRLCGKDYTVREPGWQDSVGTVM